MLRVSAILMTSLPVTSYTNLMRLAKERRHRLGETLKLQEVKREVDELNSWISDKVCTSQDISECTYCNCFRILQYIKLVMGYLRITSYTTS